MNFQRRVLTLLGTVSPLTPGQIFRALVFVDRREGDALIQHMYQRQLLCRVSCSSVQRRLSGGTGSAYALSPVRAGR